MNDMSNFVAADVMLLSREARRDIAAGLNAPQARWLVDYYYAIQDYRIQAAGQARAVDQEADQGAAELVAHLSSNMTTLEREIQKALGEYASSHPPGPWAMSVIGIGPVLAAGLLAHIDIAKAPTVGHIWRFAGYDPTVKWGKGEKRPWNASLKVLCWKIGSSFVKQSGHKDCLYGHVYRQRKAQEVARNEQLLFADQAAQTLKERNIRDKDLKACYESGKLPDGRIDQRARRYATKLFLSHLHHVWWETVYGEPPVKPYILTQEGGHNRFIPPPNWPPDGDRP
jgi:hypothetical protein